MRCINLLLVVIMFASCSKSLTPSLKDYTINTMGTKPEAKNENIDYSNLYFWAAHPNKKSPATMVPKPLQNETRTEDADVFFIHPTTFLKDSAKAENNADIFNETLNRTTDYGAILYQATAFNKYAKIYAPRYRQSHIRNYFRNRANTQQYFDIAYNDVKVAFKYYLANFNNGRPIIIASHSQGTEHAGRLMKEFFDGKPLQKQLVAAYLIGMPLPVKYFTNIPACITPAQTGCACSWRTFKTPFVPKYIAKENFDVVVTNPIWFTDTKLEISRFENAGSVLKNFNKISKAVTSAKINGHILHTPKLYFLGSFLLKSKNYHVGDINLFYVNIRENVGVRLANFKK